MIDAYERKARVYPALLVGLPCALFGIVIGVTETAWWPTVVGAALASGFYVAAAQIGRTLGKNKEKELYDLWGGKPTTHLLRHCGPVNPVRLARIHGQLEALIRTSMPTAQDEVADSVGADAVYESAVDAIRVRARDHRQFPLLFKELCNYGFRRNLWALRPWGLGIALIVASLAGASLGLDAAGYTDVPNGGVIFVLLTSLGMAFGWGVLINPRWVEQTAIAYAEQMLDAVEHLAAMAEGDGKAPSTR